MNPTDQITAEAWARQFHDTYERLAPSFGYETREETRQFDPTTPNGRLMIAVCGEVVISAIEKAHFEGYKKGRREAEICLRESRAAQESERKEGDAACIGSTLRDESFQISNAAPTSKPEGAAQASEDDFIAHSKITSETCGNEVENFPLPKWTHHDVVKLLAWELLPCMKSML